MEKEFCCKESAWLGYASVCYFEVFGRWSMCLRSPLSPLAGKAVLLPTGEGGGHHHGDQSQDASGGGNNGTRRYDQCTRAQGNAHPRLVLLHPSADAVGTQCLFSDGNSLGQIKAKKGVRAS